MDKKVVWQPLGLYQPGYDFGIYLDKAFAEEMLAAQISSERQGQMNKLAYDFLEHRRLRNRNHFIFHERTALVTEFSLGHEGRTLSVGAPDPAQILSMREGPLKYDSHNIDDSSNQSLLMILVDLWVEYSEELIRQD